jgi:hypothetical protein
MAVFQAWDVSQGLQWPMARQGVWWDHVVLEAMVSRPLPPQGPPTSPAEELHRQGLQGGESVEVLSLD